MPYKDKAKQKAYQNEWMQKRRRAWIAANGPCVFCGSDESLEVDHINPFDKVEHRIWSWSDARREAELAKCQVLCRKCNLEKAQTLVMAWGYHGTTHGYWAFGCRCGKCKAAVAAYELDRRRKKAA